MVSETASGGGFLSAAELKESVRRLLDHVGEKHRVLIIPPDRSRFASRAGLITRMIADYYGSALAAVLPATGTHAPLSVIDRRAMFGDLPETLFLTHDFRDGCVTMGRVPADYVREISAGKCEFDWPVEIDRLIVEGGFDLILSIGQVVPHEVAGMSNYTKNVLIGAGGAEGIDKSHYLGAVSGMERIMGKIDTPVRRLLDHAAGRFFQGLPLLYLHTVIGTDTAGTTGVAGFFAGDDEECFTGAAELSRKLNITLLPEPLSKVVVYLDPEEYRSAWLCNKGIYRTRMAIEDHGTLVVLAPGMERFGEDDTIDALIRKYGYRGTETVQRLVTERADLRANLAVAAHLIHGSTEGRFQVVYAPGRLGREAIEGVGYEFAAYETLCSRYDPAKLREGRQRFPDGEEIFFIKNPALGLWAWADKFR